MKSSASMFWAVSRSPGLHSPEGREHLVQVAATIGRLRGLTVSGDFAYFVDVAHFTAGPPLPGPLPSAGPRAKNTSVPRGAAWLRPGRNPCVPETDRLGKHEASDQAFSGRS